MNRQFLFSGIARCVTQVYLLLMLSNHVLAQEAAQAEKINEFLDKNCPQEEYSSLSVESEPYLPEYVNSAKKITEKLQTGVNTLSWPGGETLILRLESEAALNAAKFWGTKDLATKVSKVDEWYALPAAQRDNLLENIPSSAARSFHNRVVRGYNRELKKGNAPYSHNLIYEEFKKCASGFDYFLNTDGQRRNKCMATSFLVAALLDAQNAVRKNKNMSGSANTDSVVGQEGTESSDTAFGTINSPF